ncbi:unnamed protein product [Didymodactylos carnosus]|uniref:EGF-like domain-containing protein n=1 Tax=Didymodactylos carnosus TaxID=1234261 RepID=A0A814FLN7_9BILA|nr:unnamed protein product [Didymodactylos carnosus]CAF0983678.1 unnamed protein product [Didymodactylos carnosus]CAF3562580.1 unnamed protein product [Didymodactylos carnosus]CAF3756050.1 unnamed protein product [Didymodactylos carnosus]
MELELNKCNYESEFCCTNGMCIDNSFSFDQMYDCMDRSDEQNSFVRKYQQEYTFCHTNPSIVFEEYNCAYMKYPCGDGDSISRVDEDDYMNYETCLNGRDIFHEKSLFDTRYAEEDNNNSTILCRKCLICSIHELDDYYEYYNLSSIICQDLLLNDIEYDEVESCNDIVYELVPNDEVCKLNLTNRFKCLTTDDCILRKYFIEGRNCQDKSNVIVPLTCTNKDDLGCHVIRGLNVSVEYFLFQEICKGFTNPNLIDGDETDETNCQEWEKNCNLKYTKCDGRVNCLDGRDELECSRKDSHECEPGKINYVPINRPLSEDKCLSIERINDETIDCYGGVDEDIDYCSKTYPSDLSRRFRCINSSECIKIENVCDDLKDCPQDDDEIICSSRSRFTCNEGLFVCSPRCMTKDVRCNNIQDCNAEFYDGADDERFCELIPKQISYKLFTFNEYNQYPPTVTDIQFYSSFYYDIPFLFLPVHRLAVKLILDRKSEKWNKEQKICLHGSCMTYSNNISQYFCLCDKGWSGTLCNVTTSELTCSQGLLSYHSLCLCTLGKFGYDCFASIDLCQNVNCSNGGTCIPLDIKALQYLCICTESHCGDKCQYQTARIQIDIKDL